MIDAASEALDSEASRRELLRAAMQRSRLVDFSSAVAESNLVLTHTFRHSPINRA
ncbi:hypothetical protein LJ656_04480 [Paraburkholderia sp. MMS20-SJTR3]|uniref:Uncharacterized protein n=1 Tax=Paraburkholderia sejongensis TaxID=2886946 RepID=A0ABS8JPN5_9BURK|nr:hypothetical protein [Paraburkholderia sp. MMS20-SJTR3]MCC8391837.1 hypothetical protein [Paraburkholderia sp. MMS20-SJTR3]